MANIPEPVNPGFPEVYQWALEDDVVGGLDGTATRPVKELVERTKYLKDNLAAETTAREELAEDLDEMSQRVQAVEGKGGSLDAYDFGSSSPGIEDLTRYACENIWGVGGTWTWDPDEPWNSTYVIDTVTHTAVEIFSSTWVRNIYNILYHDQEEAEAKMEALFGAGGTFTWNTDNPPQSTYEISEETHYLIEIAGPYTLNHKWVLTNTPDTDPRVFSWQNAGQDTVGFANESVAGVVKSVADPGDGSMDGRVNVRPDGTMIVIGGGVDIKVDGWVLGVQ
jgi:hypothetical protein